MRGADFIFIKDPISTLTHFIWAILAIPTTAVLLVFSAHYASTVHVVAFSIFGLSLVLLYTASTVYHMFNVSPRIQKILRKIDHMMIFVLIAGTYTPLCLIILQGAWGISMLTAIWVVAIAGIIMKAVWKKMPRVLSTIIYVVMGWLAVIAIVPLSRALPVGGLVFLFVGGLIYTVGGVIYALKWPKLKNKFFNFHEIFHLFVMGGTVLHVLLMFLYVLPK